MVSIKGHFEGSEFVPDEPVELPQNQPVILQYEPASFLPVEKKGKSFTELLKPLIGSVEMPRDWSLEHDHYLYGTPKRGEKKTDGGI